ncbi:MAG: hypothetical protein ABUS49_03330, partial [Acidobacteriota bacterium]
MSKFTAAKIADFKFSVVSLIFAAALSPVAAFGQCQSCVDAVKLPASTTFSTVVLNTSANSQPASGGAGFFALTLNGVAANLSVTNQTYAAWCGTWWSSAVQSDGTTAFPLVSTYSTGFPSLANPIVPGNNIRMVNYILNHKTGTVQDVQDAIWLVMTGETEDSGTGSATAQAMRDAAKLAPNYVPDAGGVMAALLEVGPVAVLPDFVTALDYTQNLLIEVPVPAQTNQGACSTCVSGIKLPATPVQFSSLTPTTAPKTTLATTGKGFAALTLTGVQAGFSITNQAYPAWGGGWYSSPLQTLGIGGFSVYSTYAATFPAGYNPLAAGNNLNMVNYILNNKAAGSTVQDVQDAIWTIMTGHTADSDVLSAAALAMVNGAKANPTYCPQPGGVIALYMPTSGSSLSPDAASAASVSQGVIFEVLCTSSTNQGGTPSLSLKKTANVAKVNPFQKVTYKYVVTNTGTVTLTGVVVVDDNGTPTYTNDDFTVGTIATLAPGASATLTATIYPPVTEAANNDEGWGLNWGWSNHSNNWDFDDRNAQPGGLLICKERADGKVEFTYKENSQYTDNTYGKNSSRDWGSWGHSFSTLASNDGAEFQILDKNGTVCLDFVADYIS